jgi:adenosylmethionine-8-amino-7-oxononanoate aminotransferase
MAITQLPDAKTLEGWDRKHIIHPQFPRDSAATPVVMVEGSGVFVRDINGRQYLDATGSGVWCGQVGHGRRELADVGREQLERMEFFCSFWNYTNDQSVRLSQRLADLATPGLDNVYYTMGGSESTEIAILIARQYHYRRGDPARTIIISRDRAYHGITYAARAATGVEMYHKEVGPLPGDFVHLSAADPYRMPDCTDFCVNELERMIARLGANNIAAMIGEPIPAVGGMLVPPDDYWPRMHEVLKEHGILLIFDEVVSGYGRTGTWWGAQQWGIEPDFLSTAKGITSGYFPLGAVLVRDSIAEVVTRGDGFPNGFTYTGHPVGCAIALKNLEIIERESLLENAEKMGRYLLNGLETLLDLPVVGEVRGRGLMLGIELVEDKVSKTPAVTLGKALGERFVPETGVFVRNVFNSLVLSPPLIFSESDCDAVVDALRSMLERSEPDGTIRE